MKGINGANADPQPDLLGIHPALTVIIRCCHPGYGLAHDILEHYPAGFEADCINVGNVITDHIQLGLKTAHT
ncbi:hypothetical protein D3C80_2141250 [compost metagenome]